MQYYSHWLLRRFEEGYVLVRNPRYPHLVTRYDLSPDKVDCVVFCSKDYRPILPRLHEVTDRFPACFFYTITAYGKDVEPGVPPIEAGMETLKALSAQVGRQRVAWRYDPVLLTKDYTIPPATWRPSRPWPGSWPPSWTSASSALWRCTASWR